MNDYISTLILCMINDSDVRVLSLNNDLLVFESSTEKNIKKIVLSVFSFHKYGYNDYLFLDFDILECIVNQYSYTYKVKLNNLNERFCSNVDDLNKITSAITNNHLSIKVEELIRPNALYPYEKDFYFLDSWEEQLKNWYSKISNDKTIQQITGKFELAVSIDNNILYKRFWIMILK